MILEGNLLVEETAQQHGEPVREIIEHRLIQSCFQPIIDLQHGMVLGWEVVSSGPKGLTSPAEMFAAADNLGLRPRLESACRAVALQSIAALPAALRARTFLLHIGLGTLADPMLQQGQVQAELASLGLEQRNVVIEISERESITDYHAFERHLRQYVEQGFRIALDHVGTGHSRLVTLVSCLLHFLKMDLPLARGIQHDTHKQQMVKSLIAFATSVDAVAIADGVESWDELETLARLGVRHAQGGLFGSPDRVPLDISDATRLDIRQLMRQYSYRESDLNEAVGPLVARCGSIREGEKRGEDIDRMFRSNVLLDHLVVVRGDSPVGLITRQHYYTNTGGPVGYPLFQWKPAEQLARPAPLTVEESLSVTAVARLAMDRSSEELYDPVVVVDRNQRLLGTITIRQLLRRSSALEVQWAQGSSPLTGLPGNRSIERWILDAFDQPEACVLYADLDRFKEFNDCYGFLVGDEMIRCLARVLACACPDLAPEARLGHIGGDDFVIVAPTLIEVARVKAICRRFDEAKLALFNPRDAERGSFNSIDRRGQEASIPLVTVSVAVVPVQAAQTAEHPGALAQMAASLKRKVKEMTAASGRSAFLFERRRSRSQS
jgi:diguanylate cyclase (GGDEF)-like protein